MPVCDTLDEHHKFTTLGKMHVICYFYSNNIITIWNNINKVLNSFFKVKGIQTLACCQVVSTGTILFIQGASSANFDPPPPPKKKKTVATTPQTVNYMEVTWNDMNQTVSTIMAGVWKIWKPQTENWLWNKAYKRQLAKK